MSFYTARDISISLNSQSIFANSLSLNQEASIEHPYREGESTNTRNISTAPIKNTLSLNYWLTGRDFLKDYIYLKSDAPISGNLNGVNFSQAYLQSYGLNAQPNQPININCSFVICDELSGNFTPNSSLVTNNNITPFNFNDCTFNTFNNYSAFTIDNIIGYNWNYRAEILPVYFQKESGLNFINPDRIHISKKEISAEIISDNVNIKLPYSGERFALELVTRHPSQSISEAFGISGVISKKDFSVSDSNLTQSSYTITQNHLNQSPRIDSLDVSTYPSNNYILIYSPNNTTNGFLSEINNLSLIDKVYFGDTDLKFNISRGVSFDTITGYISDNVVNGNLLLQSTNGIVNYSTPLTLNYPNISVSGFTPNSGNFGDLITISGANFNRIDAVYFNGLKSNFSVSINNTGEIDILKAVVPQNSEIGFITIQSILKNRSGISNQLFYPQSLIYGFNPVTGIWGNTITVSGLNFSGVNGLFFNNIPSPSFKVIDNKHITGQVPLTGAGYTKGLITLSGINGISKSYSLYKPHFPVTGLSAISGTSAEDMVIYCLAVDTGFLYPLSGGYKVSFGLQDTVFYKSGGFNLTGLIPGGYFNGQKVFLYEPDGVTKYLPYSGAIQQVGPPPIINSFNPLEFELLKLTNLTLNGLFFKDFFGLDKYITISGRGYTGNFTTTDFTKNNLNTSLTLTGLLITGATGYYNIYIQNFVGGTTVTGLKIIKPINIAQAYGTVSQSPNSLLYPAARAVDGNLTTYSATMGHQVDRGAYWKIIFNTIYNIRKVNITQSNMPNDIRIGGYTIPLLRTGYVEFYDLGGNCLYGYNTGVSVTGYSLQKYSNPITGILEMRIYATGANETSSTIGFSNVEVN